MQKIGLSNLQSNLQIKPIKNKEFNVKERNDIDPPEIKVPKFRTNSEKSAFFKKHERAINEEFQDLELHSLLLLKVKDMTAIACENTSFKGLRGRLFKYQPAIEGQISLLGGRKNLRREEKDIFESVEDKLKKFQKFKPFLSKHDQQFVGAFENLVKSEKVRMKK